MPNQDILITWQSPDSHTHQRSAGWYLRGGVVILGLAAYGLFVGSWTTTIVAILIGGIYFLLRNAEPRLLNVEITRMGIHIDDELFSWNTCRDFWILTPQKRKSTNTPLSPTELHIGRQRFTQREIIVFIQDINPADVRETLLLFLPERAGMEVRFLDSLARLLKL